MKLLQLFLCISGSAFAQLQYSSLISGSGHDQITATTVDRAGYVYVTGYTESPDLSKSVSSLPASGSRGVDAFVAKFDPLNQQWVYTTYFGGSRDDRTQAIGVDGEGNIIIAGSTTSLDLPLVLPIQSVLKGNRDGFVAKIAASGDRLLFSTYLGGNSDDTLAAMAVDPAGQIHVAGKTNSPDYPFLSGLQVYQGRYDAFVSVLNGSTGKLVYSTFLGGNNDDEISAIAIDANGNRYLAGNTNSTIIPLSNPLQSSLSGPQDVFVLKLTAAGALAYASYFGGIGSEWAAGIAVDPMGWVHIAGTTNSADLPLRNPLQGEMRGIADGFVAGLNGHGQLMYAGYLGGHGSESPTGITVDASRSVYVVGYTSSPDFPRVRSTMSYKGDYDAFIVQYLPDYLMVQRSTTFGDYASDSAFSVAVGPGQMVWIGGQTASINFPSGSLNQSSFIARGGFEGFLAGFHFDSPDQVGLAAREIWLTWYLDKNNDLSVDLTDQRTGFGVVSDIPVVGDWDGSGRSRVGVYRAGWWYLDITGNGAWDGEPADRAYQFGVSTDVPVVGDWDGSGKTKIGVYRAGWWYLDINGNGRWDGQPTDRAYQLGIPTDIPVVGDWDGSGRSRIGVYRSGWWYLDINGNGQWDGQPTDRAYQFGISSDVPIVGDWDGSGISKIGVYSNGWWYVDLNGNGQWDWTGDRSFYFWKPEAKPVVGKW